MNLLMCESMAIGLICLSVGVLPSLFLLRGRRLTASIFLKFYVVKEFQKLGYRKLQILLNLLLHAVHLGFKALLSSFFSFLQSSSQSQINVFASTPSKAAAAVKPLFFL